MIITTTGELTCRFGSVGDVAGQFVTDKLVMCEAPWAEEAEGVDVQVSLDGEHFSGVHLMNELIGGGFVAAWPY